MIQSGFDKVSIGLLICSLLGLNVSVIGQSTGLGGSLIRLDFVEVVGLFRTRTQVLGQTVVWVSSRHGWLFWVKFKEINTSGNGKNGGEENGVVLQGSLVRDEQEVVWGPHVVHVIVDIQLVTVVSSQLREVVLGVWVLVLGKLRLWVWVVCNLWVSWVGQFDHLASSVVCDCGFSGQTSDASRRDTWKPRSSSETQS